MTYALLITVFVISTCGLVYELIAGTVASYLLGDSVTQFSTVIGVYLFASYSASKLGKCGELAYDSTAYPICAGRQTAF